MPLTVNKTLVKKNIVRVELTKHGYVGHYPTELKQKLLPKAYKNSEDSRSTSASTSCPGSPPSHISAMSSPVDMLEKQKNQAKLDASMYLIKVGKLCAAIHKMIRHIDDAPDSSKTNLCHRALLEMCNMAYEMQQDDHEVIKKILALVDSMPADIQLEDALQKSESNTESDEATPETRRKKPRLADRWPESLVVLKQCTKDCQIVMQYWQEIRFPGTDYEDAIAASAYFMIELACSYLVPEELKKQINHKLTMMHNKTNQLVEKKYIYECPEKMLTCPGTNAFLAPTAQCTNCEQGYYKCEECLRRWKILCVALHFPTADLQQPENKHKDNANASAIEANDIVMNTRYGIKQLAIMQPCVPSDEVHWQQQQERWQRYGTQKPALLANMRAEFAMNPQKAKIVQDNIRCTVKDMKKSQKLGQYMLTSVFSEMANEVWCEKQADELF